jgi:hypothetical protein
MPRWLVRTIGSLVAVLLIGGFLFAVTVTFGAIHGTEFCPQTFERRQYVYYELPVVHLQVRGERHESVVSATETYLAANKLITPPADGQEDWHLVVKFRGANETGRGDADILMKYLDAKDSDDYHRWVAWSEQHADQAKVFWPAIQELALHELYVFTPEAFDLARTIDEPAELKKRLDALVAEKLSQQPAEQ